MGLIVHPFWRGDLSADEAAIPYELDGLVVIFATVNNVTNPIIYCAFVRKYRWAVIELLHLEYVHAKP